MLYLTLKKLTEMQFVSVLFKSYSQMHTQPQPLQVLELSWYYQDTFYLCPNFRQKVGFFSLKK